VGTKTLPATANRTQGSRQKRRFHLDSPGFT
jgi:hypothetical protein